MLQALLLALVFVHNVETAKMKLLKKQLKFEKMLVKHAKQVADFEKTRNDILQQELVSLSLKAGVCSLFNTSKFIGLLLLSKWSRKGWFLLCVLLVKLKLSCYWEECWLSFSPNFETWYLTIFKVILLIKCCVDFENGWHVWQGWPYLAVPYLFNFGLLWFFVILLANSCTRLPGMFSLLIRLSCNAGFWLKL